MPQQGRLMFVHAHPDDEVIGTGITMARYARDGHQVTLVTCTLGEEGEVLVPDLAHLAAENDDALGPHRAHELAAAMLELGVADHVRLGGDGCYRDSGMMGTAANGSTGAFWQADLAEAGARMAALIRDRRPHVLVTYDEFGGYGHPDHIQAHRVAMYGAQLAAAPSFKPELGPGWAVDKIYWTAFPRSSIERSRRYFAEAGMLDPLAEAPEDGTPWACPDEWVTSAISDLSLVEAKKAALLAHRTQITKDAVFLTIAEVIGPEALATEHFRLVQGDAAPDATGHESDLLAGVALRD
jgi:N-acetyl-1-D-myo-inositol-2-amino-2-deoxy-alpha-D-glucopyranoside deacetylase